jgi:septum formation inhibitor MinC
LGGRGRWISEFEVSLVYRVPGQPGLYRETLSRKNKKKKPTTKQNKQTNKKPTKQQPQQKLKPALLKENHVRSGGAHL